MKAASEKDQRWMTQAFEQARKGQGLTRPNPPVGAVIVKHGRLLAAGYHRRAGGAHAEIDALSKISKSAARGSTAYVTLEPCSTHGRTGPCTEALIQAGIVRVVYSARDPNPAHAGRARRLLMRKGIGVTEHVLRIEGEDLIRPFATWLQHGRPFVHLKLAATWDGRIADRDGASRWITSPASRTIVQEMRRVADAVLVGVETVIADDPSLTYRRAPKQARFRIVLDSHARLPLSSTLLTDGLAHHTLVATTSQAPATRRKAIEATGAEVLILPTVEGRVSLKHLMRMLGKRGLLRVLCEGGGGVAHALLQADLVDALSYFVAPKCLGNQGTAAVGGPGWPLRHAPALQFKSVRQIGPDILIQASRT